MRVPSYLSTIGTLAKGIVLGGFIYMGVLGAHELPALVTLVPDVSEGVITNGGGPMFNDDAVLDTTQVVRLPTAEDDPEWDCHLQGNGHC